MPLGANSGRQKPTGKSQVRFPPLVVASVCRGENFQRRVERMLRVRTDESVTTVMVRPMAAVDAVAGDGGQERDGDRAEGQHAPDRVVDPLPGYFERADVEDEAKDRAVA